MLQVDEKREELRRLQQRVDSVKRKMRRLSPFVDYLNRVTQMEEHQTMFPNRLAIIHRVETLMIIRSVGLLVCLFVSHSNGIATNRAHQLTGNHTLIIGSFKSVCPFVDLLLTVIHSNGRETFRSAP